MGMLFNLFIGIVIVIAGIYLLIWQPYSHLLPAGCKIGIFAGEQTLGCMVLNILPIVLIAFVLFLGAIIIYSSLRPSHCWQDIMDGDPEALALLDERIKRIESMKDEENVYTGK
jgi:uncharacterized membrane protein